MLHAIVDIVVFGPRTEKSYSRLLQSRPFNIKINIMSQSAANAPNIEKGIPLTRSPNLVLVLDTPKGLLNFTTSVII